MLRWFILLLKKKIVLHSFSLLSANSVKKYFINRLRVALETRKDHGATAAGSSSVGVVIGGG